jgi:hypothetical protein
LALTLNLYSPGKLISKVSPLLCCLAFLSPTCFGLFRSYYYECLLTILHNQGTVKNSKEWSIGLFATFIQVITLGGEASVSSKSSTQIDYSCELMTTHQFAPSLNYISKAAEDPRVKEHLKMGGIGAKAFVITGIKTVENVTITTSEETEREQTLQIGVDIPPAQITLGPKGTYKSTKSNQSTRTIEGPIVFAFQVEKIRVSRKGNVSHKEHIVGAMLGRKEGGESELVIERAGSELDEDDLDDFDLTVRSGVKDEAGESCDVIVP